MRKYQPTSKASKCTSYRDALRAREEELDVFEPFDQIRIIMRSPVKSPRLPKSKASQVRRGDDPDDYLPGCIATTPQTYGRTVKNNVPHECPCSTCVSDRTMTNAGDYYSYQYFRGTFVHGGGRNNKTTSDDIWQGSLCAAGSPEKEYNKKRLNKKYKRRESNQRVSDGLLEYMEWADDQRVQDELLESMKWAYDDSCYYRSYNG